MKILAIETSCDETAISILDCEANTVRILAHEINSQIDIHKEYGGVFPSIARREHSQNCVPVLDATLSKSNISGKDLSLSEDLKEKICEILIREPKLYELIIPFLETHNRPDIDVIAVTHAPGLEPALWVGIVFAKALSAAWNIPIVPVNHMEGHIVSALLEHRNKEEALIQEIPFPSLALLISGGHTELVKINEIGSYEIVGRTRDDAVGEAFDKVARLMGLPYPGGPQVSRLAQSAREDTRFTIQDSGIKLPRPMIHSGNLDFSFSGIKTAVRYMIEKIPEMTEDIKINIAREFEDAVIDVLISKTKTALEETNTQTLLVGGGVIANKLLRERLKKEMPDIKILIPDDYLTGDNATMIGVAAYISKFKGKTEEEFKNIITEPQNTPITAKGSLSLDKNL